MFNRCFGAALAALFLSLSLPFLVWNLFRTRRQILAAGNVSDHHSAPIPIDIKRREHTLPVPPESLTEAACHPVDAGHVALLVPTLNRITAPERQLMQLATGLQLRGWRVTVIALCGTGGAAAEELHEAGIAFLSLGMRAGLLDPRGWTRLLAWLRRARPDILHAHLPQAALLARCVRSVAPVLVTPVPIAIDTLHSSSILESQRWACRLTRRLPDQVTTISHSLADSLLSARTLHRATLSIVPHGVDVDEWRPNEQVRTHLRRKLGLSEDDFLWLAVGRLQRDHYYPALLTAIAAIPQTSRLVLAGSGPLLKNLAHLAAHLELHDRVTFLGFEPILLRWFQAADGLVHTSPGDDFPATLLQAAACALPVVAIDAPSIREIVPGDATGTLVPSADASSLAGAMAAIMRIHPDERRTMGAAARRRAVEEFGLPACFDRWEDLYGALLRRNARRVAVQRAPMPRFPARIR